MKKGSRHSSQTKAKISQALLSYHAERRFWRDNPALFDEPGLSGELRELYRAALGRGRIYAIGLCAVAKELGVAA